MARLTGTILSEDDVLRARVTDMLRSGSVHVSLLDDRAIRAGQTPDVAVVDGRRDVSAALAVAERMRASAPSTAIFLIATEATPDLILQAMRSGANEFFAWPPSDGAFHEALRRTATRTQAAASARTQGCLMAFVGAKGGVGTTTLAVNCAVDIARLGARSTLIVDLKPGVGEVGLFLGVRSRYTILDALDNVHRLDAEFLKELVATHKSGLEILGGSDNFDRPGAADAQATEEVLRLLTAQYDFVIVDAGSQLTPPVVATLFGADVICLVANPDVPSVRNTQRLLDRMRQLGPSGERTRILLNRASEPYPINPAQIEAALGHPIHQRFPSDYRTVAGALNAGVPLALTGNSELASLFENFTRAFLPELVEPAPQPARRSGLGFDRLASLW